MKKKLLLKTSWIGGSQSLLCSCTSTEGVLGGSSTPLFQYNIKSEILGCLLNCICWYVHVPIISVCCAKHPPLKTSGYATAPQYSIYDIIEFVKTESAFLPSFTF